METKIDFTELLTREPFYEVLPNDYKNHSVVRQGDRAVEPNDRLTMRILTQADFLRMYYPSGHKIMSPKFYPDILREDDHGNTYIKPVMRTPFAFQKTIVAKQVVHVCGNDVQFELCGPIGTKDEEEKKKEDFIEFKQGWLDMNMEYAFYDFVKSVKITGDAATIFYFDEEEKPKSRTLSYLNGDTLYPHYDTVTGKMLFFCRKYSAMDENGTANMEYVEVWDDKNWYLAKRELEGDITKRNVISKAINSVKKLFGMYGYKIVNTKPHGFDTIPVVYYRNRDGACWIPSQHTIETYEEAVSHFCENNKAYAFPIMFFKGDGIEAKPDAMTGAIKALDMPEDADAGFLQKSDVSNAFVQELTILYDQIYEQSFTVKPPKLTSADITGVAIKLLYSPAIELAMHDAHEMQECIEGLVYFVKYAYGFYKNIQASLISLPISAWIEPYIHQNDAELMSNLATAVGGGFLSKETATLRSTKYSRNGEWEMIIEEDIAKRKRDAQANLEEEKAKAEINKQNQNGNTQTSEGK